MKKIFSLGIIGLLFMLGGCQLANQNTNEINVNLLNNTDYSKYSVPVRIAFQVFHQGVKIPDSKDSFYFDWRCQDSFDFGCNASDFGKGFSEPHFNLDINDNTINDVHTLTYNYYIEVTIYMSWDNATNVYFPSVTTYYPETNQYKDISYSGIMTSGVAGSGYEKKITSNYDDSTIVNFDFKVNFKCIDNLEKVEFLQYDSDDNLVTSTVVTQTDDISTIVVNENTAYIIAKETYINNFDEEYTIRNLFNKKEESNKTYYTLKFMNPDGFVYNNSVILDWNKS